MLRWGQPRCGTAWVSILVGAAICSVFSLNAFATLVVVDVVLYSAALLLELAALVVLRVKLPDIRRPFRVPGGWPGITLVVLFPLAVLILSVGRRVHEKWGQALVLSLAIL